MIKQILHKVFSINLALLVLFSTISFTVEKHYCGETLVDVSLFTKVETCAMGTPQGVFQKKTCCKHEIDVIQGQDELKVSSFEDLNTEQQLFLFVLEQFYSNFFEDLPEQISPHKDYSPPNLVYDIQVLDQTFLI